ncbi:hypothetical protein AVEN_155867-1 [Araneus ventricosus]|uniref:Uncharacterized protein n=1 Tax=Araneus ventricosus TaxID=182803 RepID=A0A4Y2WT02_ARAVE|nr:hypothetical protein AVEN_155867-1 [Araneus ventricosus]
MNDDQMTTPELAPPSPNYCTTPTRGRLEESGWLQYRNSWVSDGSSSHLASSDSLTNAWAPTVHKLCHNQAFCGLCDAQLHLQFTCGDPTILPYELIYSRKRSTVGHNVRLSRTWEVLDVCASRLITLTPLEHGAPFETLLSVHLFYSKIKFVKHAPLLLEEIG